MKKIFFAIFIGIFAMAMVSPAQAGWFFEPGEESPMEVSAGDEVSIELWFHNDAASFGICGWDLDFQIDISEIAPATEMLGWPQHEWFKVEYEMGMGTLYDPPEGVKGGFLTDDIYTLSAGTLGAAYGLIEGTNTKFATIYFDILDPVRPFDDLADITLITQIGTSAKGMLDGDNVTMYFFDGATGPSVGTAAAVPVPAAVWLIGSAMLGLIGIRRKFA